MAVRKFIVVAGQNNATEIAEAPEWEEKHLYAALRSPSNLPSQSPDFTGSPYTDIFTLPFTFKGGPQAKVDGATLFGSHQNANLMGKATRAVKYLTFYDPTASYQNSGTATTSTYPGTGTILAGSTSLSLITTVFWQYDPTGVVITRRRTGTTHTVNAAPSAGTNTITFDVAQALVPPPEAGELFDYTLTAGAATDTTTIKFESEFGGNSDPGSANDPETTVAIDSDGKHACYVTRIRDASGYNAAARVTCRSHPVYIGQPVKFTDGSGSPTYGPPPGIDNNTTYYVTRKAAVSETVTASGTPWVIGTDQLDFSSGHGLGEDEPITLAVEGGTAVPPSTFPTAASGGNIDGTTTYYVEVVDHDSIKLRRTIGGTAIDINGYSSNGPVVVTRLDSYASFHIAVEPGGTELITTGNSGQHATVTNNLKILFEPVFRGSLTGLQARCLTGTTLNVGESRALHDVKLVSTINVVTTDAWPAAVAGDDTFAIEVPALNNQTIPLEKWAMWLPWSPFEGNASYDGPAVVSIASAEDSLTVTLEATPVLTGGVPVVGTAVKFFSTGNLAPPLVAGQTYYVESVIGLRITLKDSASSTVALLGASGGLVNQSSIGETGGSSKHVMP